MPTGENISYAATRTVGGNDIEVRHLRLSDLDRVVEMERAKWDREQAATAEELFERIDQLPELAAGAFAQGEDRLLASMFARPVTLETIREAESWRACAYAPLPPRGSTDCLFGVSLTSTSARAAEALFRTFLPQLAESGYRNLYGGSTVPGLREWIKAHPDGSPTTYVHATNDDGTPLDRQLRYYYLNGFTTIVSVKPNYFPHPQSLDYGAVIHRRL
ncbi:hypothetical protein [Nocardia wallacei]|uniref:N-acetyltransferase domain-containing protein n=1 Tax=Nocardia wallacei TaxID=480035 RepID=A0A7G1KS12_9NOCA|nr:hypothetical protein [Nocardia wallacei]BCK57940.1 hypothetical protein NWFMUON74_57120 [Nocardia wallacei]